MDITTNDSMSTKIKSDYTIGEEYFMKPQITRKVYELYLEGRSVEEIQTWLGVRKPSWWISQNLINAIINMMNEVMT